MNSEEERKYLSKLNDISLESTDYRQMLRESLELILEIFSCDRAWFLYPADPNAKEYSIPIIKCRDDWYIPEGVTLPMDAYAKKLTNTSLENETPVAFYKSKEPFVPKNVVEHHTVQSLLITSIDPKIDMPWIFGIHQCTHEKEWSDSEIDFFKRVAKRMRDGLRSLLVLHKMKESEEKYRRVIEETRDWITIVDNNGCFVFTNHMTNELFGITPDEIVGKPFIDIIHPDDVDRTSLWFEDCLKNKLKSSTISNRQITADGGTIYMDWTCTFVYKDDGSLNYVSSAARNITLLKQTEIALQQNKALLTEAEILTGLGSWEWDIPNDIARWSDGLFNIFKRSPEEGAPSWEHHHKFYVEEDFIEYLKIVGECLTNGTPYEYELRAICSDGEIRHCIARGKAERNEEQVIHRMWGTLQDITEHKKVEKELIKAKEKAEESEYFFKETQSAALIGSYKSEFSPNDKWETSEVCDLIFGINGDYDKTVQGWTELLHPDCADEMIEYLTKDVMQKNVPFNKEYKVIRHSDGETRWVLGLGETISDANGTVVGLIGTTQDITERKQVEEELRKAQNYISNIINSMPSALIGVDADGRVTQWNSEAKRLTGLSVEEAVGKLLSQAIPRLGDKMEQVREAMLTKEVRSESRLVYKVDNETRYEDVTIYPLIANGVEGAVIRVDDVTKDYMLQEQLSQSRKMDAIGQLSGGVAHDFNNMLGGIVGAAQLLQSPKINLGEKGLKYVEMIIEASSRAADLTAKLLAFGRKGKITSASMDVHAIIDDTLAILESTIDKKINISVSKNAENSTVVGDTSALQSVLLNLGINAAQAMPNGGELKIETRNIALSENYCTSSPFEISAGEYVEIEVRDTGGGIALENINKIFEPFFTTKEQGKGSGLGLASVYGTIQNHSGAINVYSEVGTGTAFHLYIPCSNVEINNAPKVDVLFQGSGQILLVDDEEIIRLTGKNILEEMGYRVILAENGEEAIEIFEKQNSGIDLVIMDMIMPKMNGAETFYKMKEIDSSCRVIISSGFTKDENLQELKNEGLVGFIQKPFMDYELSKLLVDVFNK